MNDIAERIQFFLIDESVAIPVATTVATASGADTLFSVAEVAIAEAHVHFKGVGAFSLKRSFINNSVHFEVASYSTASPGCKVMTPVGSKGNF